MGRAKHRERGAIYIVVLSVAMLVTVMGVAGLIAVQVQGREAEEIRDVDAAHRGSRAAVELARLAIANDGAWRQNLVNGAWSESLALDRGTIQWSVVDEIDGDLGDDDTQPVRVFGLGRAGQSARVASVVLSAVRTPFDSLGTAIRCEGPFNVPDAIFNSVPVVLEASGGPISCKAALSNFGIIDGDVEAASVSGTGTIEGDTTTPSPDRSMPPASVFDDYLDGIIGGAAATEIPWNNTNFPWNSGKKKYEMGLAVLTPTLSAPGGVTLNPNGLYLVRVPSSVTLQVDKCRLNCTMLFEAGVGATVHFGAQILWEPARADFPLAVVRGADTVELDARGPDGLSEASLSRNFNPAGFEFNGTSNATMTDTYPAELRGVVHILGASCKTKLFAELHTVGCVLCEGQVSYPSGGAAPDARLTADPGLLINPPRGYYTVRMVPSSGTWRREPAPD